MNILQTLHSEYASARVAALQGSCQQRSRALRIGDEEKNVKKGDFYPIPANVPHGDICIGEKPFIMLDIFYPVREDFLQKLNEQTPV
jgi:hypothetical protein